VTASARLLRSISSPAKPGALEPPSFDEFVQARAGSLFRTAYLLTGNRPDAEDVLQTSLVKLYVAWSRATAAGSLEAYARRVVVNT
jgi:DNA-directed RNA polymerase specialized sigma24 family protein